MHCKNCSGNDFTKTKSGNFKCNYCGSLYYIEPHNSGNLKISQSKKAAVTLVAVFVILLITVIFFSLTYHKTNRERTPPVRSYTFTNKENLPEPQGEIVSISPVKDMIGNVYFIALCRNSGKVAIQKPMVVIRLLSDKNEKIATGRGYGFIDNLNPGEITPVNILVQNCPEYKKIETDFNPELPFLIPEGGVFKKKFSAEISGVSLKKINSHNSHRLTGTIKNTSVHNARFVQTAVILYDKDDRVIGYSSTHIKEKILKPGDFDFFDIRLTTVNGTPDRYTIFSEGHIK